MKAAVIKGAGQAPVYTEFDEPVVTGGRQLVNLVAAGLHPVVRALAGGGHYASTGDWPLIPGVDAVARTADGRLVYTGFTEHPYGTFAERLSVPMTLPLPVGADPVQIAAGLNPGLSSWLPLRAAQADRPLGVVLVLGATGVAGALAIQNARALGADHLIAAGRNRDALDRLAGPDVTLIGLAHDSDDPDDSDERSLATAVADHRPSVVLDFVWGRPAEIAFAALTRAGLDDDEHPCVYVEIGASAGAAAALPAALLRSTSITIKGSGAGSAKTSDLIAELPAFMARIADGSIRVPAVTYPLAEVTAAWQDVTRGERVVLTA